MKNKRSNKQLYQDTFRQIQLSEEGYRQIRNMEESIMIHFDKQNKKRLGFRVAISLAALTVVLLSANGVAYAATGSTLVEQIAGRVSVYINGKPYDGEKVKKFKDKDGNINYQVSVDEEKDKQTEIYMEETAEDGESSMANDAASSAQEDSVKDFSSSTVDDSSKNPPSASQEDLKTTVKQVDNAIYLILEGISKEAVQVDITHDYADGSAEGTLQIEGAEYQYSVRGTVEEYTVDIEKR